MEARSPGQQEFEGAGRGNAWTFPVPCMFFILPPAVWPVVARGVSRSSFLPISICAPDCVSCGVHEEGRGSFLRGTGVELPPGPDLVLHTTTRSNRGAFHLRAKIIALFKSLQTYNIITSLRTVGAVDPRALKSQTHGPRAILHNEPLQTTTVNGIR